MNVRIADFLQFNTVGRPSISPDGSSVLYTVSSWVQAGLRMERFTHVWLSAAAEVPKHECITASLSGGSAPLWSPDGSHLSFVALSVDARGTPQVWVREAGCGLPRCVTSMTDGVSTYQWSPDSSRLFVVGRPRSPHRGSGHIGDPIVWSERMKPPREAALVTLRGDRTPITMPTEWRIVGHGSWAPDGTRVAVVCEGAREEGETGFSLWIWNCDEMVAQQALSDLGETWAPTWSPDGRTIALISMPRSFTTRHGTRLPDFTRCCRLLLYDVAHQTVHGAGQPR